MENSTITFSLEEQEEKRNILVRIRFKYNYSSEESVLHYLKKVFPNPGDMNYSDKIFFPSFY